MLNKLRGMAQRAMDDPLVLWVVVAVLVAEGVLLALYVLGVL
jgi:hypothetical protein